MNFTKLVFGNFVGGRGALALFLLRMVSGLAFVYHGWPKIQAPFTWMGPEADMPGFLQALAALSEFGGGLAWMLGALTPLFSLGLLGTMAVATYTHAVVLGDPFVGREGSYELALVYLVVALMFLLMGPGKISVDYLLCKKKIEP